MFVKVPTLFLDREIRVSSVLVETHCISKSGFYKDLVVSKVEFWRNRPSVI